MITSADNKRIKNVIQLIAKAKARKEQEAFVIEGRKLFEEAPLDMISEVYMSESCEYKSPKLDKVPLEMVKSDVFNKMTDTLTPQGILCVLRSKKHDIKEMLRAKNPVFLVLETIQDPGNLGTIVRTAEGAGVSGIIMNNETVDIYNPKTVRSTMGSIFRVPFVYTDDLSGAVGMLKAAGVTCYAAHLNGKRSCYESDFRGPAAFFVGNEGNGLSEAVRQRVTERLLIPCFRKSTDGPESLNVAIATAIVCSEIRNKN